jgi:hypothetical protein
MHVVKPTDRYGSTFCKLTNKEHDMHTPTKLISSLMLALVAIGNASAQTKEEDHKAHHPQAAASASAPAPAADMASKPAGMGGMDGMHEMHDKHQKEMKKIHGTKDPAKRQKLMDKHMTEMHEHMDKNGGMDKSGNMGMMGQGMGASAPGGDMKPGMGSKMGAKPMQDAASK